MAMLEAYLAACKASGTERPREDLAAALGDSGGDGVFRLSAISLRCARVQSLAASVAAACSERAARRLQPALWPLRARSSFFHS